MKSLSNATKRAEAYKQHLLKENTVPKLILAMKLRIYRMKNETIKVRKQFKEKILELKQCGYGSRYIANLLGISKSQ